MSVIGPDHLIQPPPCETPAQHPPGGGEGPVSAGHWTGEAQVHHPPREEQPAQRAGGRQTEGVSSRGKNTAVLPPEAHSGIAALLILLFTITFHTK